MNDQLFKVDPLYYQSNNPKKDEFIKSSAQVICDVCGKKDEDIFNASSAYINNPDGLRNFIFIVQSWKRLADYELTDKATTLAICSCIFAVEGLCYGIKPRKARKDRTHKKTKKDELSKKAFKLFYFMKNFLSDTDKKILLNAFLFSREAPSIPMRVKKERHLMYNAMLRHHGSLRDYYNKDYCSAEALSFGTLCQCGQWLETQDTNTLNKYIKKLASHLYKMRCAVVHDGIAPHFCHTEEKPANYASWNMTIADMYTDKNEKKERFIRYESAISRKQFEDIFVKGLWEAFSAGLPIK